MIYEKMLDERQRLEEQIRLLQLQLKDFPEGKLIIASNGKGNKWYQSDGHNPVYLSKKERQLAEKLAHKKYLSLQMKNMLHEKKAIDFYLRHHDSNAYQTEQSLINSPEYRELLAPSFTPLSQELNEWMNSPYEKSEKYPENLVHKTYSGNPVRSKSEAIIDMFLYKLLFFTLFTTSCCTLFTTVFEIVTAVSAHYSIPIMHIKYSYQETKHII